MKKLLWHLGQEYRTILALGTAGLIIGGVVGVVAVVFGRVLDLCTGMRAEYFQPLIFCLPAAGALIELVKVLLNLVLNGTDTAFVGEFANLLIGCSLVVPAGVIYQRKKTRITAIIGMVVGTVLMAAVGGFLNAYLLLPAYAAAFGMPIDSLVGMGSAVNAAITSLPTFCLFAVVPFNLVKGVVVSVITLLLYKHISRILKGEAMG